MQPSDDDPDAPRECTGPRPQPTEMALSPLTADPLHSIHALTRSRIPPENLVRQAATLISQAVHADWSSLLTVKKNAYTHHIVHQHPDLPTPLRMYLKQRTRSNRPLGRLTLENTQPAYVDHYPNLPDASQGAVLLGVSAIAHLPLGHYDGNICIMTLLRTSPSPITSTTPWTPNERAFLTTATQTVQFAIGRKRRFRLAHPFRPEGP